MTIFFCKKNFTNTINSLLYYGRAFEEYHAMSFADVHVMNIVNNVLSLNVLAASTRVTSELYIRVGEDHD